jgi:type IV pilus assembly protein PilY1
MTDGYWNDAAAGSAGARANNDGTAGSAITGAGNATFTYAPIDPFKDNVSNSLADVAMYYWKNDLCPSITNNVPISSLDPAFWQHMVTYGIGLGVPTQIDPTTAFNAIKTNAAIAWPDPQTANTQLIPGIPARIDDLLHAAVNSRGGFFNAKNPAEFATAIDTTLAKIINSDASSASAVAANSTQLKTGTQVYQALFDPKGWYGNLVAYNVDAGTPASAGPPPTAAIPATGALTKAWSASALLPAFASRNIYTYNPDPKATNKGIQFQWANLTAAPVGTSQQDYLNKVAGVSDGKGSLRVNWLRGDNANEVTTTNPGGFRSRTSYLGDIINSDPVYVGNEDHGYGVLPGTEGSDYSVLLATSRTPMIYVGANDGMLHGFDANSATGGKEIFAYIPNVLFPELSKLTLPSYTHQYYVDGLSGVGDIYTGSGWRTVLAGTTGAGGRAVFGLDVTNPDDFTDPTKAVSKVLWEFTNANDVDLGNTLAQPSVVRLQDGKYAVIVGNGYNSDNGHAVLFVLNAQTGAVLQKIDTGAGTIASKNGLSSPIAVDTNNDRSVDTVYAGDLYGNLWKFDLSGSSGTWAVPTTPLFVACTTIGATCTAANRQPITGKPNVGSVGATGTDQNGVGQMIYFGTGKYFETGDNSVATSPQIQTFYGLWDIGSAITDRANLQEQTIDFEGIATTAAKTLTTHPIRVVSQNAVCYAATSAGCTASSPLKRGWALNLLKPVNVAQGERVVSFPLVRRGLVVFATAIPNSDPCGSGGVSWLMEVDALMGGRSGGAPFDTNGDGKVDDNDKVAYTGPDGKTIYVSPSGENLEVGIHKAPAKVESATGVDYGFVSGSTGQAASNIEAGATPTPPGAVGGVRRSWIQLK